MNKYIFLLFIITISFNAKVQGNLQFNQVLTFTGSIGGYGSGAFTSTAQTVPSGKVWKIEHIGGTANTLSGIDGSWGLSINSGKILIFNGEINQISSNHTIWLKENDVVQYYAVGGISNNFNNWSYVISLIEFNIIP
jgi:hypothetical protein